MVFHLIDIGCGYRAVVFHEAAPLPDLRFQSGVGFHQAHPLALDGGWTLRHT